MPEGGRRYARAPIVEASIAIAISETLSDASVLESAFTEGFTREPAFDVSNEFEVIGDQVIGTTTGEVNGYVFRSDDSAVRIGTMRDAFIGSSFSTYETWEKFSSNLEAYWSRYKELAEPRFVSGIAVRFVNRIDVPSESIEFKDYLRTSVDVSSYLPQSVTSLFMRIDVPLPKHGAVVGIVSALAPQALDGHTSLLLDIEARSSVALDVRDPEFDANLRGRLETLRNAKNYVFEASITDATRRLIE